MAALSTTSLFYRENEPYRRAFHYIQSKLIQTLLYLKEGNFSSDDQRLTDRAEEKLSAKANLSVSNKGREIIPNYPVSYQRDPDRAEERRDTFLQNSSGIQGRLAGHL